MTSIVTSPVNAVYVFMKSPRPAFLSSLFISASIVLLSFLLPTLLNGSKDVLQTSSLSEHLTPEEYSSIMSLSPIKRAFGASLFSFFSYLSILVQGFIVYLFFAIARYPGLYKEYFSACLVVSFYDTIFPMILSLIFPFIPFSSLNLASLFPNLNPMAQAFLQPLDLFVVFSLVILSAGTARFANTKTGRTTKIMFFYLIIRTIFFGSLNLFFT